MLVTYTARTHLIDGHSEGGQYELQLQLSAADPEDHWIGDEVTSDDGAVTEVEEHRVDRIWSFTVGPYVVADAPAIDEWFFSVLDRSQFTFDVYGTSGSPDDPKTGVMVTKNRRIRWLGPQHREFSFRVREVG